MQRWKVEMRLANPHVADVRLEEQHFCQVGGPDRIYGPRDESPPLVRELLDIGGIDHVTMLKTESCLALTKHQPATWDNIFPRVLEILRTHFGPHGAPRQLEAVASY